MSNISSIIESLNTSRTSIVESLGDRDVITVSFSKMAREIENKLLIKYGKALEDIGTEPTIDVYIRTVDDATTGIRDILDGISINIYFSEVFDNHRNILGSIKQVFKKYSYADFRYSKNDDSYFIETEGQFDSFDLIESMALDGINLKKFYHVIPSSQIDMDRYENGY